jgi:hypothetical protein
MKVLKMCECSIYNEKSVFIPNVLENKKHAAYLTYADTEMKNNEHYMIYEV